MTRYIDNSQDVLDIRDLIERLEELEEERNDLAQRLTDATVSGHDDASAEAYARELREFDEGSDGEELRTLREFLDNLAGSGGDHEWNGYWYPVTLVRDSYFEEYAEEMAEDLHGDRIRNAEWPMNCIDWERAAREMQQDYSSAEYDGVTYWFR